MIRKVFLLGFVFFFVVAGALDQDSSTSGFFASAAIAATPEELRAQNMREFEIWRESIPDYEKRLYNRVKMLNKRLIRRTNLILIVVAALFLVTLFWVKRQLAQSGRPTGGNVVPEPADPALAQLEENQVALARLEENQVILDQMLTEIGFQLEMQSKNAEAFGREQRALEELVRDCRKTLTGLNQEIGNAASKS